MMLLASYVATDAGMSWSFAGTSTKKGGRYELVGKELRGEVAFFVAPKGGFDAEKLYRSDTQRTKEADASKGFTHVVKKGILAGMPAILSDQRYLWDGAAVASRCVYATKGNRAWVVRLWWPPKSTGAKASEELLKSFRFLK